MKHQLCSRAHVKRTISKFVAMLTQYYQWPYRHSNPFWRTWVGKSSFLFRRRESLGWFAGMLPQKIFAKLGSPRCHFLHFDIISRSLILWETIREESVICNAFIPWDREKYFIRLTFFPFVFTCLQNFMINRKSLIKVGKAGGNATNGRRSGGGGSPCISRDISDICGGGC